MHASVSVFVSDRYLRTECSLSSRLCMCVCKCMYILCVRVEEWIIDVIKAMYVGATTAVKTTNCESEEFEVKVGVHQGSVLSPLLFIIAMQALSNNSKRACHGNSCMPMI